MADFTGKERDVETGLDYFEARYFSGAQGRFTSPDEFQGGIVDAFTGQDIETNQALPYADIGDPQTLNKYSYVMNNPLRYVDPNGHCPWCIGAVIGAIGGGAASYVAQKWSHPDQPVNWKKVGASALGGAVAGATFGLAAAPGAIVTLTGTATIETGVAVQMGAGAVSGVAGGVVSRAVESGGDTNKALGTPQQVVADAVVGAGTAGLNATLVKPAVQESTQAGRAVTVGEGRIASGTKPSPSLPQRQAQLATQQQVAAGAASAAVKTVKKRAEQ